MDVALPLPKTWSQPGQDSPGSDGSRSGPPSSPGEAAGGQREKPHTGEGHLGSLGFPGTRCLGKSWGALAPREWVWRQDAPVLALAEPVT